MHAASPLMHPIYWLGCFETKWDMVNLRTAWKFECDWHWNKWLPFFLNLNKQGPVALAFLLAALSVSLCGKVKEIFWLKGGWHLFQMSNQLKKFFSHGKIQPGKNYTIQIFFYRGRANVPSMLVLVLILWTGTEDKDLDMEIREGAGGYFSNTGFKTMLHTKN